MRSEWLKVHLYQWKEKMEKSVFLRAQTVLFAVCKSADLELDRLMNECILKQNNCSKWATPIQLFQNLMVW